MQIPGLLPLLRPSEVVPLYIGYLTMVALFFVYIDKKADHVRIIHL